MLNQVFKTNKSLLEKYSYQPDILGNKPKLNLCKSYELFEEAKEYISGGITGLRNPNFFIYGEYPVFLERGKGCYVWDVDHNRYIDYLAGFGPTTIGLSIDDIDAIAIERIKQGFCLSLTHKSQLQLVKMLKDIIPCMERTLLCKTGTDATVISVRLARAYTGKTRILTEGFHGWGDFSQYGEDGGVLEDVKKHTTNIPYGDYEQYEREVKRGNVAAIMITPYPAAPMSIVETDESFIRKIRNLCNRTGIVLIFDEIRTAFRFSLGGVSELINVKPDIMCIAKALANGYSIAAVGGKSEIFKVLQHSGSSNGTFISSTYYPNSLEMDAAMATIEFYIKNDVISNIKEKGFYFLNQLKEIITKNSAPIIMGTEPTMPSFMFNMDLMDEDMLYARTLTLYTYLIRSGILMHPFRQSYITYSHTYEDLKFTIQAIDEGINLVSEKYPWK